MGDKSPRDTKKKSGQKKTRTDEVKRAKQAAKDAASGMLAPKAKKK